MSGSGLEIDHIFVFVEEGAPERHSLEEAGLRESYRRDHPGQGTTNVCYCFENLYLELLWANPYDPVTNPAVKRTQLDKRALWKENGGSPFGIALRPEISGEPFSLAHWNYEAPYLPEGVSIPFASLSDDLIQPLIFFIAGGKPPKKWQAPVLQNGNYRQVSKVRLFYPIDVLPHPELIELIDQNSMMEMAEGAEIAVEITFADHLGQPTQRLRLPAFTWERAVS